MTGRKEQKDEKTTQTAPRGAIDPTARGAVPDEDLRQFARAVLPLLQAFYASEEGKRAFEEWKRKGKTKPPKNDSVI